MVCRTYLYLFGFITSVGVGAGVCIIDTPRRSIHQYAEDITGGEGGGARQDPRQQHHP